MEPIDGEDLAARLARGALPLDEVLIVARQIAEALESAHDQGIVDRDLKPANIKVRADGTVKVLDFGSRRSRTFEPPQSRRHHGKKRIDVSRSLHVNEHPGSVALIAAVVWVINAPVVVS
jgi:serine/threonine protein kinase